MHNDAQPQGFGSFLKGFFKQLWHTITHPWMLLPTLLISGAWIALGILHTRMGETQLIKILNFFTFAQGGLFGGTVGAVGGIIGKILIATLLNAMIMPIFMKGKSPFARFGKGFGGFFRSFAFDSLRALSVFLMGIGVALALYSLFNITQRWQESLVGVSAAILLIRSIGQRGGFLFSLLFSFVKAFTRGKAPSYIGVSRFLSGMVLGMTVAVGLNAFGLRWCVAFAAGALAISLIFIWFGKRQRVAFTTVCILAMIMIPLHAESPSMQGQMPKEMQDLYNKANDQSIGSKVDRLMQLAEEAEARGDHAAAERYADEIAQLYMGQANAAMDLYRMAQEYGAGAQDAGDYDYGNPYEKEEELQLSPEGEQFMKDNYPFGKGPAADDNDWKPSADDDFWDKWVDKDTQEKVKEIATEGLADEDSHVDEEDDAALLEGIGAGAAAATAAGAAAGAAGGGAGGGGLPDLPDGSWDMDEAERREEEDGEYDDEEPTEGGDGGGPDPTPREDPFKNNPYVTRNPDGSITMTSPSTGEKIDLEPDGNGGWTNLRSGVGYDDADVNEWVRNQDENGAHWQNQARTNEQYQEAFEKDAADFASHSEEDRINQEVAEQIAQEEKAAEENKMHDKIIDKANEYGVKTTDKDGKERDINDIKDDTKKEIKKDVYWDNYKNEMAIQQTCSEVELECSEKIATYEMTDQVAEGTVNVLAEYVPGGGKVKDFHTFTKATMVGGMEGYLKSGWTGAAKGAAGGAAEGLVGVTQNHLSDLTKGATGNEKLDTLAGDVLNVQMEGVKVAIHDLSRGKSIEETYSDMQEATIKKTGDILIGKALGIKDEHDANATGELIGKFHDNMKWGGGGDPEQDKTLAGHISSGWQNLKDGAAEKMYDLYYGN